MIVNAKTTLPCIGKLRQYDNLGWGIEATSFIAENECIESAPLIVYPLSMINTLFWIGQANGMKPQDIILDQYSILFDENNVAIPLGYISLYNHSDNNNAKFVLDYPNKILSVVSVRDIKNGEQITVNYGDGWFKAKGYIKKIAI